MYILVELDVRDYHKYPVSIVHFVFVNKSDSFDSGLIRSYVDMSF